MKIDIGRFVRWITREAVPAIGDVAKDAVIRELRDADLSDEIVTIGKTVGDTALAELIVLSVRAELIRRVERI